MSLAGHALRSNKFAIFWAADCRNNLFLDLERYLKKLALLATWPSFGITTVLRSRGEGTRPRNIQASPREPITAIAWRQNLPGTIQNVVITAQGSSLSWLHAPTGKVLAQVPLHSASATQPSPTPLHPFHLWGARTRDSWPSVFRATA
jgi:hypothetical protein